MAESKQSGVPLWHVRKQEARERRKSPTPAEAAIRNRLRNRKLGVKFRREHAIRNWVADFCCLEGMLVVGLDGHVHQVPMQQDKDRIKDEYLTRLGFRVLRFPTSDAGSGHGDRRNPACCSRTNDPAREVVSRKDAWARTSHPRHVVERVGAQAPG